MSINNKIRKKSSSSTNDRFNEYEIFRKSFNEINKILMAYAAGDFTKRGNISNKLHSTDAIINGINMLGEELEDSTVRKNYFLGIFNAVPDLIFVLNQNGVVTNYNKSAQDKIGEPSNSEITLSQLLESDNFDFSKIKHSLKSNSTYTIESVLQCSNNVKIPIWCIISLIEEKDGKKNYLAVARDITDQKETESKILRAIVDTQEKERFRVSQDLHDAFGPDLSAIKFFVNSLLSKKGNSANTVSKINQLIDDNLTNLRNICFNLMPGTLSDLGINEAINALIHNIKQQHTLSIHFKPMKKKSMLDKDLQIAIFRIIQEFITNTIKHANAKNIFIELNYNKNIYIYLSDDGIGFDGIKLTQFSGNGLRNMNSRVNAFHGKFLLESNPGIGTSIAVILPVK